MVQDGAAVHERIDRSCDLLSSSYRRRVIYELRSDGPATVGDLADAAVAAGIADDPDRAAASLVHVHLPKLADAGVVEYAGPDEPVSLSSGVDRLAPFLAVAQRHETPRDPVPATDMVSSDAVAGSGPD